MTPRSISIAFQTDQPLAAYGALASAAEGYGFDGVSVYNDMLFQPAWLPLLEIARHTSRVRIGPAAVNPFTCHPINIVGNIALLDEASQGRAYLGLARGAWLDFAGLDPPRPVTALREAFECVRHLSGAVARALRRRGFPLAGGDTLRWRILRPNIALSARRLGRAGHPRLRRAGRRNQGWRHRQPRRDPPGARRYRCGGAGGRARPADDRRGRSALSRWSTRTARRRGRWPAARPRCICR